MLMDLSNQSQYGHILSMKVIHTNDALNMFPRKLLPEMLDGLAMEDNLCLISGSGEFKGICK